MPNCEFCREFGRREPNSFSAIYAGVADCRIVARTRRFVAIPTLGQLFVGSLLVLPLAHVETCAELEPDAQLEMLDLIDGMLVRASALGHPICFEHGATAMSEGGCGIHHAHLHIVPLPRKEAAQALFPEAAMAHDDLASAWAALAVTDHYLLLSDGCRTLVRDLRAKPGPFLSQFFRRRLVEHFGLKVPWDWRAYRYVEPSLMRTLAGATLNAC